MQKFEDSAPEALEFDRLKEHFEPFLRASSSSSAITPSSSHHHSNPITAAASSALARDIPGVGKYNPLARSRSGRDKGAVFAPAAFGGVMAVLTHVPRPIFRKLPF